MKKGLIAVMSIVGMSLLLSLETPSMPKTQPREAKAALPIPLPHPNPENLSTARKMPFKWTPATSRTWVKRQAVSRYGRAGWECVDLIVFHESRWRHKAANPTSTAYGLFQILDTNPAHGVPTQWKRFKKYLNHRFDGDPCKAWYARQTIGTY